MESEGDRYGPLTAADDDECQSTAERTSMPGMVVPYGVDIEHKQT